MMENTAKKDRNSNLEILRIISMVLIVACHYSGHGYSGVDEVYSFNKYVLGVLSLGGKFGVACFILISGYFMVYSKFTLRKLVKLVAQTWFYAVILGLLSVFVLFPGQTVTVKSVLKIFLPVATGRYWFVTVYVVLMLISPLLNLLIANMSREMHRNVLIGATVMWSVLPTCFGSISLGYSNLGWFVVLYFFAAYIRKYVDMKNGNALKHIRGGIFSYLIVILWNVLMIYLWHATGKEAFLNQSSRLTPMNSPFILLASVELLIGFAKLKPHYNKKLNRLASATFGVYLIHDNGASRSYLWKVILKNPAMYGNSLMIVHAVISIAAVYLVCSSIDLIRQATVEKWFMNFVDKHLDRVEEKASAAVNRIVERGNL